MALGRVLEMVRVMQMVMGTELVVQELGQSVLQAGGVEVYGALLSTWANPTCLS